MPENYYTIQIDALDEEIKNIRERLDQITANNNNVRIRQQEEDLGRKMAEEKATEIAKEKAEYYAGAFNVSPEDVVVTEKVNQDNIQDNEVNYGSDNDKLIIEERQKLEEELKQKLEKRDELFEARKQAKIDADKKAREEKNAKINREGMLDEAYKFFTYLDTSTTTGYDVSSLTEDEVINLYKEFFDNREKPGYSRIWNETLERMKLGDREIVRPSKNSVQNETDTNEAELQGPPEMFGPPAPEGYPEYPNKSGAASEESEKPKEESNNEDLEGKEVNKGKWDKFKNFVKNNRRKIIIAGIVGGAILVTGSVVAGLVATGVLNTLVPGLGVEKYYPEPSIIDQVKEAIENQNIDENALVDNEATSYVDEDIVTAQNEVQMHDNTVQFNEGEQIYSSSDNAANNVNGLTPYHETVHEVDMFDPVANSYDNIDPSQLTEEQYQQLRAQGHIPLTSTDPSMAQYDGNTIAAQNKATGFTR